jgi:hypothetical protein
MRRRDFFALVGGAAAWPLSARGQQPSKTPIIGFLGASTASAGSRWVAALVQRLHELGWIEGRTMGIEYRWTDGRNERAAEIAAEFVRLKARVIVTYGNTVAAAIKPTVSPIPVVFAAAGDPVGLASSHRLRAPAETSPDCRSSKLISLENVSKFYATCFPISARWQSWPTLAVPMQCWKWTRLTLRRAVLALL